MNSRPFNRGTVFDLAVLAANFWLVPRLTGLAGSDGSGAAVFGGLLLLSCPVYCLGAWWKRDSLRPRLRGSPPPLGILIVFFVLLVMQYGLFIGSLEFGWSLLGGSTASSGFMILALLLAALPPTLTVRVFLPPREGPESAPPPAGREARADGCLYFCAVISLAWWEGIFVEYLVRGGGRGTVEAIVLTILLTVPFAIFYLSPRILLLAEDYRTTATWVRLVVVMLPLTARLMS